MNKTAILSLLVILLINTITYARSELKGYSIVNSPQMVANTYDNNNNNIYDNDLNRVEMHLYGKIYARETTTSRLNRIERTVFSQTYPTLTTTKRMNNILSCYQDVYNMRNYTTSYYYPGFNPVRRLYNRYIGYPTGFTPSITNSGIINNRILPSYTSNYYSNRGYRYDNYLPPAIGAGVRILD